jgi:hypothetical protein
MIEVFVSYRTNMISLILGCFHSAPQIYLLIIVQTVVLR